jgi:hypothetical protein
VKLKGYLLVLIFASTVLAGSQERAQSIPGQAQGQQHHRPEMTATRKEEVEAMKADLEKMNALLAQMKANLFTIRDQNDLDRWRNNVDLWQTMIDHVDHMVKRMETSESNAPVREAPSAKRPE